MATPVSVRPPVVNPNMKGGMFTGGRDIMVSAKDQPAHKILKTRSTGQNTASDVAAKNLRKELEAREAEHFEKMRKERERGRSALSWSGASAAAPPAGLLLRDAAGGASSSARAIAPEDDVLAAFDDADDDALDHVAAANGGAGNGGDSAAGGGGDDDDEEDEDDDDDTEELMRELERIKREREEERSRKERELEELAEKETTEAVLKGNPLLTKGLGAALGSSGSTAYGAGGSGSAAVKRRFGDDTVFSHTHASEPEAKKRFLNDSIRSDFHRGFMRKFFH